MKKIKFLQYLVVALFIFGLNSCAILGGNGTQSPQNSERMARATGAAVTALSISDEQIQLLSKQSVIQLDAKSRIAPANSKYTTRLNKLTKNLKSVNGLPLNYKVYLTDEINAFACADGSIRVYSGLMDVMSDSELVGILGHEIGHIANKDTKDAMRTSYLSYAALQALGTTGDIMAALTSSQIGSIAQQFISAKYSRKQEYEADDYGFNVTVNQGLDKYAMAKALEKLVSLSKGEEASALAQMFSSHPNSKERAKRIRTKADKLK